MDQQRRELYSKLNKVFAANQLSLSQIGRDIATPSIDNSTGTWADKGLYSKTPRFIIQLRLDTQGNLEAGQFERNQTSGKLGYINTANSRTQLGGLYIRILPVMIMPNGEFDSIPAWEWLLLLTFQNPLSGNGSSDTLNDFFPPSKTIKWKSRDVVKPVDLKGASLFSLTPSIATYNYAPTGQPVKVVSYDEATAAMKEYLNFNF